MIERNPLPDSGKSHAEGEPRSETLNLSDPIVRATVAAEAVAAIRAGSLTAASGTAIASLLRAAEAAQVRTLQEKVDQLSEYAKSLEAQLEQVNPRGRR